MSACGGPSQTEPLPGSAAKLVFRSAPSTAIAGAPIGPVEVELQDAEGRVSSQSTEAVTLALASGPDGATLGGTATVHAVNGVARFPELTLTRAGTGYTLRASSGMLPIATSATFSVAPAAPASLLLSGLPATITAGDAAAVAVRVEDAFGNLATNHTGTIHFESTDARAVLPANAAFTAEDAGVKTFSGLSLVTEGKQRVTATDGGLSASADALVSPAAAARLVFVGPSAPITAGEPVALELRAEDPFGNVAIDYHGTVHFTSSDPAATLPADHAFTSEDAGRATASIVLRSAGEVSVTAGDGALPDATTTVRISSAAATRLVLTVPPTPVTAGAPFAFQLSARDAFDNVATGYVGTVHFISSDGDAVLPADVTFTALDAGSLSLFGAELRTAGGQTITASDVTTASLTATESLTVNAAAASSLRVSAPASATAGSGFTVTVRLFDAYGNPATGYRGTVHFTSDDTAPVLPADRAFTAQDAGEAAVSVELRSAGSRAITAIDTDVTALTDSAQVAVSSNAASVLAVVVQPGDGSVRTALSPVQVELRDAYGNPVSSSGVTISMDLSGGNTAATLSGTRNQVTNAGRASFSDLTVDQEGSGFELVATTPGLGDATTAPFSVIDVWAPAQVTLSVAQEGSSARVTWTAVGDDGTYGTAASYDLRHASFPITDEATFAAATPFAISPPQASGTAESALVTGVDLTGPHYFALSVVDGAGNASRSNTARLDGDPCAAVTCTAPANGCSADGRSIVSYTSACVVSGGVGSCQNTPAVISTCQAYETCSAGACVAVTSASQRGNIVIDELNVLGAEFIELRNTTAAAIDVRGYTFRNAAGQEAQIRAPSDPNGTGTAPVSVPAGGVLFGIANPSGAIPADVGFVYGAPGTSFALADTGDALAIYAAAPDGRLEDAVDFRSFVTNANTPLTATSFIGFAGSSTQLDAVVTSAAANDTATNWCVSFYPAPPTRGARITNTAGTVNGSCNVAVINEVLIDAAGADDAKTFVEVAGPGGSMIGGAKLVDLEGLGATAGSLNTDGDIGPGETDGVFVIPAGTRIPADGILLVADATTAGSTTVANFVAGVDVLARDMDMENSGGDAIELVSPSGQLLDTVGHDIGGANLATNTAYNGLALYETATALTPPTPGTTSASTLARNTASTDSGNNRNDFHADPTPTPGGPNDAVSFTVTGLTPDDGPVSVANTQVTVTGSDFTTGMKVIFGSNAAATCSAASPTSATCPAPANAAVARVNVTFQLPASVGAPDVVLPSAFTYTGAENETDSTLEADYCNLQFPASFSVTQLGTTTFLYGQVYEAGVTEAPGAPAGVLAEVGYGTVSSDPRTTNSWKFFAASFNTQVGNNDEFVGTFTAPSVVASTNYSYTFRFSQDGGVKWTYCDLNGAGSGAGLTFEATQLGVMTVTP